MIKNILTNLKIEQLNAMQEAAIDTWKEGKDLILLSPTGSGKTLAYLLPLLQSLKPDVKGVQAIVLVPSRELALQIDQVFKSMNTPFKAVSCYGGRPAMEEHRTIKGVQPSVVIGTPGRMNDHLSKQNIDAETVTTLVIDEFDKCLEFGFQEEMATVIGQLPRLKRRFLLSATDAEEIPQFTGLNKTIKLNFLNTEEQTVQRLHLYKVLSPGKDKLETLYKLLCTLGSRSTLVFCNHRESVERVGKYLQSKKFQCGIFHGGMSGNFNPLPVALALQRTSIAMAHLSHYSVQRTVHLSYDQFTGLTRFLTDPSNKGHAFGAIQKSFMGLHVDNMALAQPVSLYGMPVADEIEDTFTNLLQASKRLGSIDTNLYQIYSVEMLHAAQAVDLRRNLKNKDLKLADKTGAFYTAYRAKVPYVKADRIFTDDIRAGVDLLKNYRF